MRNASIDWTEAVLLRLRSLWAEGHSTAEIGRRLGISKNAVVGKAHRLSLPARPSPITRRSCARQPRPVRSQRVTLPAIGAPVAAALVTAHPAANVAVQPVEAIPINTPRTPSPRAGRVTECCWPVGQPGQSGFRFCSEPSEPSKPYCAEHCRCAYVRTARHNERATSAPP